MLSQDLEIGRQYLEIYCGVLGCGRLLDLGVIGNYDTPPKDTAQINGYRQAVGTRYRVPVACLSGIRTLSSGVVTRIKL